MRFRDKEQITISLTGSCNLQCIYCYMPKEDSKGGQELIDFNFCMRGIQDFFQRSTSRCIRFFAGGEPTLAFPLMKKITDAAKKLAGDDLRIELETNGYFSDEVADWIGKNVNYLWISCDGIPEIQKSQRPCQNNPNAHEVVYQNIRRFAKQENLQFGVRATLKKVDLEQQLLMLDFFKSLGVKTVCAFPAFQSYPNNRTETADVLAFAKDFVPAYEYAKKHGILYLNLFMVNFDQPVDIFCQASIPTPRLTRDGYVSCCDWAAVGPERLPKWMEPCIFGRYDFDNDVIIYDQEKIALIQKRNAEYLGKYSCKGCRALQHCAGGCLGKVMSQSKDMFRMYQPWCEAVLYLYDHLDIKEGEITILHP